ncbi:enhancer of mRNA-decapping protein 3 [Monosporozyma unispora]|nr:enhancer of mRNA decapping [Kazachstania unispora]
MTHQSQFVGFGVQVELKDGKLIQGKIGKATSKGLTLYDVKFSDGGTSQAFKVRSSRLKDLKVLSVAQNTHGNNKHSRNNNNNNNSANNAKENNKISNSTNHSRTVSSTSINSGNNRQKNNRNNNNNTGKDDWQNDDVEKIKEGADFDFQSNLEMFNKKDIFAQLKQQDEIDPSDRLVSHNRKNNDNRTDKISSSSSNKNNNYEIDEMVIPDAKNDTWNQITHKKQDENAYDDFEDSDDDDDDDEEFEDANYFPITKSINITHLLHSAVNSSNEDVSDDKKDKKTDNGELLSKLEQMILGQTSNSARTKSVSNFNPTLTNPKNKKQIPMATPVQLLEMERLTEETFHISRNDCIDNNFALNSSYYIRQKLGGESRLTVGNSNPEPLVVVLASDSNRSGSKALTLARYLCQTQQIRVLVVFTCSMKEIEENNKPLKANIDVFTKCGGKVANDTKQLKSILSTLNSPIELIIDAMQGFDCSLIDFDSNQNKIINMINWCNETIEHNNVKICSIDVPSGYDSGSGLQNFDVAMHRVDYILCSYTWPLISLSNMKSIISHNNHNNDGNVILIDCGIPKNVYLERNSLRKFHGVDTFTTNGHLSLSL